jgi:hypothetical protein
MVVDRDAVVSMSCSAFRDSSASGTKRRVDAIASRICSSAADMSWKYVKKYESTARSSLPSTTFTSMVSRKSRALDLSTSIIVE